METTSVEINDFRSVLYFLLPVNVNIRGDWRVDSVETMWRMMQ